MFSFSSKKQASKTVGIQVTANVLYLSVIDYADGVPTILDSIQYEVREGQVTPQIQGKIQGYVEGNQLNQVHCCVVLDDKDYQLLVIEAPNVPANEMAEAVKWKVKDLIPYPLDAAVIDVFLQPENATSPTSIAHVVAAKKALIDDRVAMVNEFGLAVVAVDIPEFSYRNYYQRSEFSHQPVALVSIREGYSKLTVIHNESVYFSRSFPIHYKAGLLDDIPESEIVLELQRSLDYYERQLKQSIPNTVIYSGDNLTNDKITSITRDSLNQQVVLQESHLIAYAKDVEISDIPSPHEIATCGAALRENLLGAER